MDLPQAIQLAQREAAATEVTSRRRASPDTDDREAVLRCSRRQTPLPRPCPRRPRPMRRPARGSPGMLAEAAGYTDHELWWERQIEQRRDANGLFEGILEAMTALRTDLHPQGRATRRSARRICARPFAPPKRGIPAHRRRLRRVAHSSAGRNRDDAKADADTPEQADARQGRGHLDSLDQLAALLSQRLWRRRRFAWLVRAPLDDDRPTARFAG